MPSLNLGWELCLALNNGANCFIPVTRNITITNVQMSCSFAPSVTSPGINQVLFMVQVCPSRPFTQGSGQDYMSGGTFTASDWGTQIMDNPSHIGGGGGFNGGGSLMSMILKGVNGNAVNQNVSRDNLNIVVPVGSYILCHMDHAGLCGCDVEIQGSIYYIYD
jgi:hypothetical protein